ncbi:hypothetical protein ABENE_07925 [Asticcacaulis benevestitus DSM 16100 = ATCC BAA-896]|uniref:Type IV secretion system protein VirB3 n=2 Tax=Asticcacaulis TaxID=76890 RepID=V4PW32_9CAUL|nr:hypothetical protein ABENE_07925 [Asticcacaulis benevestitus DSM 16100 = ATCC BAA-896]
MFLGVPMVPFLVISATFLLAAVWLMYLISPIVSVLILLVYVPLVLAMRQITKKDDQRLGQMFLRARMRLRHQSGRKLWCAISYSPLTYMKRKL